MDTAPAATIQPWSLLHLLVFACLFSLAIASTSPQEIALCGMNAPTVDLLDSDTGAGNTWAPAGTPCIANSMTGLNLLFGFTYYLSKAGVGTQTETKVLVIDTLTNNVVRLVNITSTMPTTSTVKDVAVRFHTVILLNPSYLLAFCTSAVDSSMVYGFSANNAASSA
jgi:hypothetical protein